MVTEPTNRRMKKYISIVHGLCLYPDIWPVPQNAAIICSPFVSMTHYRQALFSMTYFSSLVFFMEYTLCIWMKQYHFMRCLVRLSMDIGA